MSAQSFLLRVWLAFTTFGTLCSLASVCDDVIAWSGFIVVLIGAYRALVDAVWGALFGALALDLPRWTHDYFTLTSLMSASILWALSRAGEALHIPARSLWTVLRDTTLDFTVGGDALRFFAARAREGFKAPIPADVDAVIDHVSRSTRTPWLIVDGLAAATLLVLSAIFLPILAPPFLAYRDRLAHRRALRMFAARRLEVDAAALESGDKAIIRDALLGQAKEHESFAALARLYHETIRRQIVIYYAAVAVGFLGLVLLNLLLQKMSAATAAAEATAPS